MIVQRRFFRARPGTLRELVTLNREFNAVLAESWPAVRAVRLYTAIQGPSDVLCIEYQFESVAEGEAFWGAMMASPEWAALYERVQAAAMPLAGWGPVAEVWQLE